MPICIFLPAHLSKHLLPVIIQGTFGNSRQDKIQEDMERSLISGWVGAIVHFLPSTFPFALNHGIISHSHSVHIHKCRFLLSPQAVVPRPEV